MYETTIQANTSHMHILQKLAEQLQPFIQSHHGLLATLHIPTGKQLTFAVPEKYSALLQKQIRHYVACFICEEEKYQYFVKNIMFSSQSEWWKEALFKCLNTLYIFNIGLALVVSYIFTCTHLPKGGKKFLALLHKTCKL